jgi:hypothetical protein
MEPDRFMNQLLSSGERTWAVPEHATITLDPNGTGHMLEGAVISHWSVVN